MINEREDDFTRHYDKAVSDVYSFWTSEMQEEISRHNVGWAAPYEFREYLRASSSRYFRAYHSLTHQHSLDKGKQLCDIGGFWGVFPLTLTRMGFKVAMTESLSLFGTAFDPLFDYLRMEGVDVIDHDPFGATAPVTQRFDAVTIMAVIEHYPHSLKSFMRGVRELVVPGGGVYIEVPNIAYWPNRMRLLRGQSPLTPLQQIWDSAEPFTGHHHEFTLDELRALAEWSRLTIVEEHSYNYSFVRVRFPQFLRPPQRWPVRITEMPGRLLQALAFRFLPSAREVLAISCRSSVSE